MPKNIEADPASCESSQVDDDDDDNWILQFISFMFSWDLECT